MIKCTSRATPFETDFTNGTYSGRADAPKDKGGGDAGFRPFELLEAAVGGCINIWLRIYAASHDIPLAEVVTEVTSDRQNPGVTIFRYAVELQGPVTEAQRRELFEAAHSCPVHQALSGKISLNCTSA
ncbi:MAG: OsmC family protein [Desulfobaccales bacterium]